MLITNERIIHIYWKFFISLHAALISYLHIRRLDLSRSVDFDIPACSSSELALIAMDNQG